MSVHDIRQLLYRLFGSVLHTFVVLTDQPSFAARTISICQARTLEDSGTWLSVYDIRQLLLGSVLHTLVIFTDQPTFATRTIGVCRARILEDPVAWLLSPNVVDKSPSLADFLVIAD